MILGRSLGERPGLAFGGPQCFLDLRGELADSGRQLLDPRLELNDSPSLGLVLGDQSPVVGQQLFVPGLGHP
jgi:hypothetical protein